MINGKLIQFVRGIQLLFFSYFALHKYFIIEQIKVLQA